jgi:N-acetylglucosamine-6-phosphate deacetylase
VAAQLPQHGVTAFLPTVITAPLATYEAAMRVLAQGAPADFVGAEALGWHFEGPFLNEGKKGAHNPVYLRPPRVEDVAGWSAANGVKLVTLAPEQVGATAVIEHLVSQGVVVSAGHSLATFEEARAGFEAGIRYGTHLFNAMPTLHHREPGLVGALLADERVTIGIIPDGIHVHPSLVRMAWRAANGRVNVVTDAMGALGTPPGKYELGDFGVTVTETTVRLADGTLAGSVISMDAALRKLIEFTGCSLAEGVWAVTAVPAELLGIAERKGHIAPGYDADLVLLSPELAVAVTIVGGEIVYQR